MKISKAWVLMAAILSLALVAGACSGVTRGSDDATIDERAMSRKLDLKDVDLALDKLMADFVKSGFVKNTIASGARQALAVDLIVNETDQHGISTDRLLQSFETKIMNLDIFDVVDQGGIAKLKAMLREQESNLYDGGTVPNSGNLLGFKYIIGGKLFGETERLSGEARTQYRLFLKAVDIETGMKKWQGEVDVSKLQN